MTHCLRLSLTVVAILLLVPALTGCAGSEFVRVPIEGDVASSKAITVQVENHAGNVRVVADEWTQAPTVGARLVSDASQRKDRVRAQEAAVLKATVLGTVDQPILRVQSTSPEDVELRTNLTVRVPRLAGVRVRTTAGRIQIDNPRGSVTAATSSGDRRPGDIYVRSGYAITEGVNLETTGGAIVLQLPPGTSGRIGLHSEAGEVTFRLHQATISSFKATIGSSTTGRLGTDGQPIIAQTADGPITFLVTPDAGTRLPPGTGLMRW